MLQRKCSCAKEKPWIFLQWVEWVAMAGRVTSSTWLHIILFASGRLALVREGLDCVRIMGAAPVSHSAFLSLLCTLLLSHSQKMWHKCSLKCFQSLYAVLLWQILPLPTISFHLLHFGF
jgi:hypothetical protein